MKPERYREIEHLYHSALERKPEDRTAFLDQACAEDETLRREVESLLGYDERAAHFMETPPDDVAAGLLAAEQKQSMVGRTLGHYQIVSLLGTGGMGEVYLAEDTRLRRKVAIKLLPAEFTADAERLRRFELEARAASALNHPNIVTIHEIGQVEETPYIVTEFIDGQTLRKRIRSVRLKLGEAFEVAVQVASALAAAHAAGIIHRDIKPENIMVRPDGLVKVLDFGLAKLTEAPGASVDTQAPTVGGATTEAAVVMGTARYMSPEQARGLKVDARTDIFSLGVVTYEMITGQAPFEGATTSDVIAAVLRREPLPLARYVPEAPTELDRIVAKALRKDREERYQVVKDLLLDLKSLKQSESTGGASHSAPRTLPSAIEPRTASSAEYIVTQLKDHRRGLGLTLAILLLAAVAAFFYFKGQPTLTEKDTVLLADFVNTTGEAVFDGTLKQALAVQLQQTPFLNLFPEEGVRGTLTFMGRSPDERVTRQIGREICQRQGLKAMLIGTVASLGRNYVITLEAINGQTGEAIASQQVEAEAKEQVLRALGQAATGLRRGLGESLSTIQKYNAPIEQATTSSLEALKAFSAGLDHLLRTNYREAHLFFNRAIELDPNFAEAYDWLAWVYLNLGDLGKAAESAEKAFALRDRVTERERLNISTTYHHLATGEWDKQNEVNELFKRLYPNDWIPHNDLAINYNQTGQFEKAIAEEREALRLNPNVVHPYGFMSTAFIRLNRFDEAREVIRQAQAGKLDGISFRRNLYEIAFVQGDTAAMRQQLDLMVEKDGERTALTWQALTAAFAGRRREARAFYRRRAELDGQRNVTGKAAPLPIEATMREALFGFCQPAGEGPAQALALSRITSPAQTLNVPILPDGSLCGGVSEAERLADELAKRYPRATLVHGFSLPTIRAAVELQRHQPDRAIEFLRAAAPYEGAAAIWPTYLRGQAYLRLGRGAEAAAEFRKILGHRGWDPLSVFYPLAHLGLARAAALAGDAATGRKAYQDFLALWKDADADLPILVEAKKEYERLK